MNDAFAADGSFGLLASLLVPITGKELIQGCQTPLSIAVEYAILFANKGARMRIGLLVLAMMFLAGCTNSVGDAQQSTDAGVSVKGEQIDCDMGGPADRVLFGYDGAVLNAESQRRLDGQVEWLNQNSNKKLTIEGHADERGTREYNLALGERRANAVKNYLVALGVDASRINTVSYGKERPAVTDSTEDGWAQNRRAVTVVDE